jgi:hypothetical protein
MTGCFERSPTSRWRGKIAPHTILPRQGEVAVPQGLTEGEEAFRHRRGSDPITPTTRLNSPKTNQTQTKDGRHVSI